ncbi:MAG: hypothetical protein Q4D98_01300 [Planctomycetia bacterium]|nr:hypothetical protein [Planctomycetia bacterium]
MESLPIILVHQGNSSYLEVCLRQARQTNPHSRIVWLHGEKDHPLDFVDCFSFHEPELFQDVAFFSSIYQRLSSSNSLESECFCIQRWLIVRNFMRREKITRALAIDSDVLIFCDVTQEAERFRPYAMTFAHWNATQNLIHCNFIQDISALEAFADYSLEVYQNSELLERLKQTSRKGKNRYRVSDMSLFYDWSTHSDYPFCFFEDFYPDGIFFDSCIDFVQDFKAIRYLPGFLRPFKKIVWKEGLPHATLKNSTLKGGLQAPMKIIHYHGGLKFLMPFHFQRRSPHVEIFKQLLLQKWRKLPAKLRRIWNRNADG